MPLTVDGEAEHRPAEIAARNDQSTCPSILPCSEVARASCRPSSLARHTCLHGQVLQPPSEAVDAVRGLPQDGPLIWSGPGVQDTEQVPLRRREFSDPDDRRCPCRGGPRGHSCQGRCHAVGFSDDVGDDLVSLRPEGGVAEIELSDDGRCLLVCGTQFGADIRWGGASVTLSLRMVSIVLVITGSSAIDSISVVKTLASNRYFGKVQFCDRI